MGPKPTSGAGDDGEGLGADRQVADADRRAAVHRVQLEAPASEGYDVVEVDDVDLAVAPTSGPAPGVARTSPGASVVVVERGTDVEVCRRSTPARSVRCRRRLLGGAGGAVVHGQGDERHEGDAGHEEQAVAPAPPASRAGTELDDEPC